MPNCFALSRKGDEKKEYVKLVTIDEEMCAFFKVVPDPVTWYYNWENTIGLGFALGKSFDELREIFKDSTRMVEILNWMEERFDVHAWAQIGRY